MQHLRVFVERIAQESLQGLAIPFNVMREQVVYRCLQNDSIEYDLPLFSVFDCEKFFSTTSTQIVWICLGNIVG